MHDFPVCTFAFDLHDSPVLHRPPEPPMPPMFVAPQQGNPPMFFDAPRNPAVMGHPFPQGPQQDESGRMRWEPRFSGTWEQAAQSGMTWDEAVLLRRREHQHQQNQLGYHGHRPSQPAPGWHERANEQPWQDWRQHQPRPPWQQQQQQTQQWILGGIFPSTR